MMGTVHTTRWLLCVIHEIRALLLPIMNLVVTFCGTRIHPRIEERKEWIYPHQLTAVNSASYYGYPKV